MLTRPFLSGLFPASAEWVLLFTLLTPAVSSLYRWQSIVGFALLSLETLLIAFLLRERRNLQRTRAALIKSEERNRSMLLAIPDLMFFQSEDGTYLDYHAKDPGLLLLPPAQFLGKKMEEVLPAELSREFRTCFNRAVETKEAQLLKYSLPITGEPRWFEARVVSSDEVNLLTIVRDITESHRAEQAVRESESRFAAAFKFNPQPMTLATLDECRFIDVNQSFLNMSGYERDEVIGRTSVELNMWEFPGAHDVFLRQLNENGSIQNAEMRFRTKAGALRLLQVAAESVEVAGGQCTLVTASDITELKQAEQWLSELTARLLKTQDQERRRIAQELHDVTAQGLGLALLNLRCLKTAVQDLDSRCQDRLAESISLGEQALKEIRTLSYVLHPPLLDQSGLVTALDWYAKGFTERSGIRVDFSDIGDDGHRMPPDVEYSLFRVVQECLNNIRRHTNSETAIIILKRTSDDVVLQVRDQGSGMNIESFRNGDEIEGLGVGVPGMRHRLKQLGGELTVDSAPNGTTVTATVPVRWVIYDTNSVG